MTKKRTLITSALPYANGPVHIGHLAGVYVPVIYLKSSVPTLVSQIQKRGRDYEKSISIEYLSNLNDRYDKWIADYKGRILVIEADELDFEHRPEDFALITDKIDAELYGLF